METSTSSVLFYNLRKYTSFIDRSVSVGLFHVPLNILPSVLNGHAQGFGKHIFDENANTHLCHNFSMDLNYL